MPAFTLHKQLEDDSVFMRDLSLSQLRLQNQRIVPWLVLVPRREGVREIYELPPDDRAQLMNEIAQISEAVKKIWNPVKINVAALGNIVPQLHVHVIGRFEIDPAWPKPVWENLSPAPYTEGGTAEIRYKLDTFFKANP